MIIFHLNEDKQKSEDILKNSYTLLNRRCFTRTDRLTIINTFTVVRTLVSRGGLVARRFLSIFSQNSKFETIRAQLCKLREVLTGCR